jgi:hypothetical protein
VVSGSNPNYGGCMVFLSVDGGNTYQSVGTCSKGTTGSLSADYPLGSDPDTTDTLSVDLTESGQSLMSEAQAVADTFTNPYYIAGASGYEAVCPTTATLTAGNKYNLTGYIRRGVLATKVMDHLSGSRFAALDSSVLGIPLNPTWIGKTLHFKFASYNPVGGGLQPLSECTDYTYSPTGVWKPRSPLAVILGATSVITPSGSLQAIYSFPVPGNLLAVGDGIRISFKLGTGGTSNGTFPQVTLCLGPGISQGQTLPPTVGALIYPSGPAAAEITIVRAAGAGAYTMGWEVDMPSATPPTEVGHVTGSNGAQINWSADLVLTVQVDTGAPGGLTVQGLSLQADFITQPGA